MRTLVEASKLIHHQTKAKDPAEAYPSTTSNSTMSVAPAECCPKFDASQYADGENAYKIIAWDEKPFVKDGTWCLFYVPLAFGRAMTRALKKIEAAGAEAEKEDFMIVARLGFPTYS